ncbi:MAG: fasciclin domain-containing protein [Burkholderiales bacterium]|nr:fasciclin domain-containing protein [Burkholderiales bacterium]
MSLTACATAEPTLAKTATTTTLIVATAQAPELSTFTKLVQQAGLSAALEAAGPVTVFAPTDEAFKAVPAATLDKLSKDPVLLKSVLTYHMIPGGLKAADLGTNTGLTTLNGAKLAVSKAGDFVTVDDGLVTKADINATNGVIHEIDRLLMPAVNK